MPRDIQFDVLGKIRAAGVNGSATLCLSRSDAARLVDGLPAIDSAMTEPEHIDTYEGTADDSGILAYRLDERLPKGTGAIEQPRRSTVHISLGDVIP